MIRSQQNQLRRPGTNTRCNTDQKTPKDRTRNRTSEKETEKPHTQWKQHNHKQPSRQAEIKKETGQNKENSNDENAKRPKEEEKGNNNRNN